MKPLIGIMPGLVSGGTVYTSAFVMLFGGFLNGSNSFVQLIVHLPIYYGMSDVVAQVERTNEEAIDSCLCNGVNLVGREISMVRREWSRRNPLRTFCNASLVSICTIVSNASLAWCRYSVVVWMPNFSMGNGDPNPL